MDVTVEKGGSVMARLSKKGYSKSPRFKNKISKVMREYKVGALKSSSGHRVTNPRQAIAIGLSEARRAVNKKRKSR